MEPSFWHDKWERRDLGFHQSEINPLLQRHWPRLGLAAGAGVFVPLAGKSLDLRWLAAQGHPVLGVELSETACTEFFTDNGLPFERSHDGPFERFRGAGIELLCGDFFALQAAHLAGVAAIYDRAALIALPPPMRRRYVAHLQALCPPLPTLLITLDYEQAERDGPPFSVPESEVRALYEPHWPVRCVERVDLLVSEPRYRERGMSRIEDCAFVLGALAGG